MYKQHRWVYSWFICLFVCGGWLFASSDRSWAHPSVAMQFNHRTQQHLVQLDSAQPDVVEGQVWKDVNWDGVQQYSDPYIPYTVVALYRGEITQAPAFSSLPTVAATPLLTATTTITGWYHFTELAAGNYYLTFSTPGSMAPTLRNQGTDDTVDSDIVGSGGDSRGFYGPLTLTNTGQTFDLDAGFVAAVQMTVYVYEDTNHDQKRQVGEPALPGAVVMLYTSTDSATARKEISRLVVDDKGAAKFTRLAPGQYTIDVWPPEGYTVSQLDALTGFSLQPGADARFEAPLLPAPKAVDLVSFTAKLTEDNTLVVRWLTAAEKETYGFRLLRQDEVAAADTAQVVSALIPSQGVFGGLYEVQLAYNPVYDAPYETLSFWLVEYEFTGTQHRYGPISVAPALSERWFLPLIVQ